MSKLNPVFLNSFGVLLDFSVAHACSQLSTKCVQASAQKNDVGTERDFPNHLISIENRLKITKSVYLDHQKHTLPTTACKHFCFGKKLP